ncbi:FHA domain-containing protein [Frondihabitans cladoniiphilus]|uniref:FHA domain-containing protein n=1 Tax=Frondihabitans cladoniiphilus TaxID=715785 RepID=A0ABP8VUN7_9MICO
MTQQSPTGVDADEPQGAGTHDPGTAPTSTHAEPGAGRPRLIFKAGEDWDGTPPREFDLLPTTTVIGSGPDADLQLEGLDPVHARIEHTDDDEYVLTHATAESDQNAPVLEGAALPGEGILRTGSPVELGTWSLSYYRDEFADHGRPGGGRQGGEGEHQPPQQ